MYVKGSSIDSVTYSSIYIHIQYLQQFLGNIPLSQPG